MTLLDELVRHQAEERPEAVAVAHSQQTATYREMEESGNRLARMLKISGCVRGDRVGLLLPKSIPALLGMLGTLKAGCIYVPMDTASPAARLAKIIDAAEPRCILAIEATTNLLTAALEELPQRPAVRVGLMEPGKVSSSAAAFVWDDLAAMSPLPVASGNAANDAAHILFTSGSTGTPKGVVITHSNVMHFLRWAIGYFGTTASDRISCHPPLHFDLSTFDIWGTFLAGAQLHLVPQEMNLLPHKMAEFIRRSELTQWFSVPSALKYMAQFDTVRFDDFPSMTRLLWCGEALPTPTLMYWMKRLPKVTFTNLYGPTETTIASSYYTVPRCPEHEQVDIPIGQGCGGEELIVLDEALAPTPEGEIGDLYISGVGMSPGYWRNPEKTEEAFLNDARLSRIYKTGDLARVGRDGMVYLLGRADSQIKSRGYRIELGEIETALNALGVLRECAVVAVKTDGFEGMSICCAYSVEPGVDLTASDLRQQLTKGVPSYMLPSQWKAFDKLPLNANGKIDRPRLREHFMSLTAAMQAH